MTEHVVKIVGWPSADALPVCRYYYYCVCGLCGKLRADHAAAAIDGGAHLEAGRLREDE